MPNVYPNLEAEVASPDSNTTNTADYISVGEALKLIAPFKGVKSDVLAFTANVDTAFEVNDPRNEGTLFKFVLTRISEVTRTAQKFGKLGTVKGIFKEYVHREENTRLSC
jgi:hypothetical protein